MQSAQENAQGLTTDLRGVYGLRALSAFGMGGGIGPSRTARPTTSLSGGGKSK